VRRQSPDARGGARVNDITISSMDVCFVASASAMALAAFKSSAGSYNMKRRRCVRGLTCSVPWIRSLPYLQSAKPSTHTSGDGPKPRI